MLSNSVARHSGDSFQTFAFVSLAILTRPIHLCYVLLFENDMSDLNEFLMHLSLVPSTLDTSNCYFYYLPCELYCFQLLGQPEKVKCSVLKL